MNDSGAESGSCGEGNTSNTLVGPVAKPRGGGKGKSIDALRSKFNATNKSSREENGSPPGHQKKKVKGLLFDEKFHMEDTFMTEEEWLAELDQLFDLDDDIGSDLDEWFD